MIVYFLRLTFGIHLQPFKLSANPKLTVLHNFGFLYDSINIRNSFRLKKNPQKNVIRTGRYYAKTILPSTIILIGRWQLLSSHCQIRTGHMTAKHMCVCASQKSRNSQSWKLSKLLSCEIYECLRRRKKDHVPFLRQSQDQRKGRKHLAVKRQQTSLRATKVLSSIWNCFSWAHKTTVASSKTFHLHRRQCPVAV